MESYRESLPQGRYPLAFVFLECNPAEVDVNVHPAKREVRFRNEAIVRGFVIRAVLSRLREWAGEAAPGGLAAGSPPSIGLPAHLPAPFQGWVGEGDNVAGAAAPAVGPVRAPAPSEVARGIAHDWRFVGAALGGYAVFETPQGLVLLDRRAAHERVWYERLKAQFGAGRCLSSGLLLPDFGRAQSGGVAVLTDQLDFLRGTRDGR